MVEASCRNKYDGTNFISPVPTSLLIAPGLQTIQFLFGMHIMIPHLPTTDMADSRPTTQQIGILIDELSDFFPKHCAMYIRKFVVNNKELMLKIPHDDRIQALKEDNVVADIFLGKIEQPGVKILGISWNYVTDQMYYCYYTDC
jgi:hypothetical protein